MSDGFKDGYEFYVRAAGAQLAALTESARIEAIDREIGKLYREIAELGTNKTVETLSGDIAEFYHADTFNIDAILNDSSNRAYVPRVNTFASPDVVLDTGEAFQIKYYADGAKSARAQAVSLEEASRNPHTSSGAIKTLASDGATGSDPIYDGMGRLIPDDQLTEADAFLDKKIAKESVVRPDEVRRYSETKEKLTSTVSDRDGISSKGLSREESKQLARESKEGSLDLGNHGISADQLMEAKHIAKASLKAGLSAAAIAALLQAAPSIIESIQELAQEGSIDLGRLQEDGADTVAAGGSAFVTGALTAALTDMAQSGKLGESLVGLPSAVIASATVIAFNALKNGIRMAHGEMDQRSYADAILNDTFIASCALASGMLGQAACPIPALGYMLGSFVGSAVGGLTYQAGKQAFISFSVEHGATFFGLVDQDYELPDSVLNEIGLDVFEYDRFAFERPALDVFAPSYAEIETSEGPKPAITLPRRGVIAVGKVGYVL